MFPHNFNSQHHQMQEKIQESYNLNPHTQQSQPIPNRQASDFPQPRHNTQLITQFPYPDELDECDDFLAKTNELSVMFNTVIRGDYSEDGSLRRNFRTEVVVDRAEGPVPIEMSCEVVSLPDWEKRDGQKGQNVLEEGDVQQGGQSGQVQEERRDEISQQQKLHVELQEIPEPDNRGRNGSATSVNHESQSQSDFTQQTDQPQIEYPQLVYTPNPQGHQTATTTINYKYAPKQKHLLIDGIQLPMIRHDFKFSDPAKQHLPQLCSQLLTHLSHINCTRIQHKLYYNGKSAWCYVQPIVALQELIEDRAVAVAKLLREVKEIMVRNEMNTIAVGELGYAPMRDCFCFTGLGGSAEREHRVSFKEFEEYIQRVDRLPEISIEYTQDRNQPSYKFRAQTGDKVQEGEILYDFEPSDQNLIGVGTYGEIFMDKDGDSVVKKRLYYDCTNYHQVRTQAITQYCILHTCQDIVSAQPTPTPLRQSGNSFQFSLQRCLPLSTLPLPLHQLNLLLQDLTTSIQMMHSLNIFHRDIKPDNIVYSLRLKRPVLIDFGLAVHNPKSYHGRQFTGYCGTVKFMGEEMRGLAADREGYVDLARNDREALRRALEVLRRGCAQQKQTEEGKTQEKDWKMQEKVDLEEEFRKAGSGLVWKDFQWTLRGLYVNKQTNKLSLTGSIFRRLSKSSLIKLGKNIISSLKEISTPSHLFQICRFLIRERIKDFDFMSLKSLMTKELTPKQEKCFKHLFEEYEILVNPVEIGIKNFLKYTKQEEYNEVEKGYLVHQLVRAARYNKNRDAIKQIYNSLYPTTIFSIQTSTQLLQSFQQLNLPQPIPTLLQKLHPHLPFLTTHYPHTCNPIHRLIRSHNLSPSASPLPPPHTLCDLTHSQLLTLLIHNHQNNFQHEQFVLKGLDAIFQAENGLEQNIKYTYPERIEEVEDIEETIVAKRGIKVERVEGRVEQQLPMEEVIDTRNIMVKGYKIMNRDLQTVQVLIGSYVVNLSFKYENQPPIMTKQSEGYTIYRRGEDIQVILLSQNLQQMTASSNIDTNILQFIRRIATLHFLNHMGCGLKIFTIFGVDFVISNQSVYYLTERSHFSWLQSCSSREQVKQMSSIFFKSLKKLHSQGLVLRNICQKNIRRGLQRQVYVDVSRARVVVEREDKENSQQPLSYTEVCGVYNNMGISMKELVDEKKEYGYVNLFKNDEEALVHAQTQSSQEKDGIEDPEVQEIQQEDNSTRPINNHIQLLLKLLIKNSSNKIKWILENISHWLGRKPNYFQKSFTNTPKWQGEDQDQLLQTIQRKSIELYSLQQLHLSSNLLEDSFFSNLSKQMYSLVVMDFSRNCLTREFVGILKSVELPVLRELNLFDNAIGEEAYELFEMSLPRIKFVNIGQNSIRQNPKKAIMAKCQSLESLILSYNQVSYGTQIQTLLTSLPNLSYLNIQFTNIEEPNAKKLMQNSQKLEIRIGRNPIIIINPRGSIPVVQQLPKLQISTHQQPPSFIHPTQLSLYS